MKHHESVPLMDWRELPAAQMLEQAEQFLARMKQRHTVREFSDRPVDRAIIEAAIAAAGRAPSGANHQPWHFCAIGSADAKRSLRELAETGVDRISIGTLTKDVKATDFSMRLQDIQ